MLLPILPLGQLALGLLVFHLCRASMKLFRHSEASFPAYWKMGFLERLQTMSRRTEMAYKAKFPGKSAQHDKAQGLGDMVNAAAV